jgi:hypothetical protein
VAEDVGTEMVARKETVAGEERIALAFNIRSPASRTIS